MSDEDTVHQDAPQDGQPAENRPAEQTAESQVAPADQTQTPGKMYAGKFSSVEELEKGYENEQRKINDEATARARAEAERDALMTALQTRGPEPVQPKPPDLDAIKEKIRTDPGAAVVDLMMERDLYWSQQLQSQLAEVRNQMVELRPEYQEVKPIIEELAQTAPEMPREKLVNIALKMRERFRPAAAPQAQPQNGQSPLPRGVTYGNPGGATPRAAPVNTQPKLTPEVEMALRRMGWTADDIKKYGATDISDQIIRR